VITDANPLGEAASRGSRLLLQKALEAKVAGFLSPERRRRTVSILCAYAIGWDGTKVLLHLTAGDRESRVCWGAFLDDIERRGLGGPLLVVVDGNTGVRKSVRRQWPTSFVQRCQVHKLPADRRSDMLGKLPHRARPTLRNLIRGAFTARTLAKGLAQAQAIIHEHREALPAEMACLEGNLDEAHSAPRFPLLHRRQIRATDLLERLCGEGRRRAKVIGRFHLEAGGLSVVFAVLVGAPEGWREVRMRADITAWVRQLGDDPDSSWHDPDLARAAA